MERAKVIRQIMDEKGIKVADISRMTQIPYSTIKSLLENGVGKTAYSNVCAICNVIGITPDKLEQCISNNVIEEFPNTVAAHLDTDDLTADELEDVASYIEFVKNKRK